MTTPAALCRSTPLSYGDLRSLQSQEERAHIAFSRTISSQTLGRHRGQCCSFLRSRRDPDGAGYDAHTRNSRGFGFGTMGTDRALAYRRQHSACMLTTFSPGPPHSTRASSAILRGSARTLKPAAVRLGTPRRPCSALLCRSRARGQERAGTTKVYLRVAGPEESGQAALCWPMESLAMIGVKSPFRGVFTRMDNGHGILRQAVRVRCPNVYRGRARKLILDERFVAPSLS
ncbi:hypothetical protein BKA70DRAFT_678939 [Coprinopsis sp. MPI-PUGE-AT-0042]|nr:hypothetical protein BKA70DRAFT_678939 [Coprinopsis sp. MPI-PUGE-AT-0042]